MTRVPASRSPLTTQSWHWTNLFGHRPLLLLALIMAAGAIASAIGMAVDERELLGQPLWAKPFKFCVSIAIYSLTLSWLLQLLQRWRRLGWWVGTISAVLLTVEILIIGWAAAVGTTSHFNVSSPLATTLWAVMGTSIAAVWVLALVVAALLLRQRLGDMARTVAVGAGLAIGLTGMALAFLMTSPTADQLADFQGVAGAHAVGVADGGPGLPILGWSTEAGDLRVPHFVGMHGLQALPLLALGLEFLARWSHRLRQAATRGRLVAVGAATYAAVVALVTWQALRGQSIVQPDAPMVAATAGVAVLASTATVVVLIRNSRSDD